MWMHLALIYGTGLIITAFVLFRTRMFQNEHVMNVGAIMLWPVYWGFYLLTLFLNRSRR